MTAGAPRPVPQNEQQPQEDRARQAAGESTFIVRTRGGEALEGLEVHGDGVSFRAPRPMLGGARLDLVICDAILVETKIVGCARVPGSMTDYWIRARFHGTDAKMNTIISEEVMSMIGQAE